MVETCSRCGRARPVFIADPTCPKGGGYCDWKIATATVSKVTIEELFDRIEDAYNLLAEAEECEDASSLFDLCIAARKILKPNKRRTS